ncbi:MAG: NAD-dependent epimerase/dehydratase family protein [Gemmatimonadota bacterium]
MSRRIAVTGPGGFFGRALEARLAALGRLRGLFRLPDDRSRAWEARGHEVVVGDIADPDALARLVRGADTVYHLAARLRKDDPEESRRVNVEGTERLARAAGAAGARRLVYVSSISVYAASEPSDRAAGRAERGPDGVHTLTEQVEPRKIELLNPYSATKYEGERVVRDLAERGAGPPFTIVRPTNVYGPWGRSWFLDWVRRLEKLPVVIGGRIPVDMVHVDDIARGLVQAAETEGAAGQVFHLGHEWIPLADYAVLVGEAVGLRVRKLPAAVDLLARFAIERGHRLLKGDRMSTPLTRRVRYPHDKAGRLIGYRPRIRLEEGMRELGRWHREVWSASELDRRPGPPGR